MSIKMNGLGQESSDFKYSPLLGPSSEADKCPQILDGKADFCGDNHSNNIVWPGLQPQQNQEVLSHSLALQLSQLRHQHMGQKNICISDADTFAKSPVTKDSSSLALTHEMSPFTDAPSSAAAGLNESPITSDLSNEQSNFIEIRHPSHDDIESSKESQEVKPLIPPTDPLDLLCLSESDYDILLFGSGLSQSDKRQLIELKPPPPPPQQLPSLIPTPLTRSEQVDDVLDFFDAVKYQSQQSPTSSTIKGALGNAERRPTAAVPTNQLEDAQKKSIYVIHGATCTPCSWFSETPASDVREMILSACDAMIDGGFLLREVAEIPPEVTHLNDGEILTTTINDKEFRYTKKRRYEFEDFHQLTSGGTYCLEPAVERLDLKVLTGDRWRRIKIRIDPLKHVETEKAISMMQIGSNLLKHTDSGYPHLRQFQLSSDRCRLLWYSAESKENTTIHINSIKEIRLGQQSPLFQKYKLPCLEHLSFSIIFDATDTLSSTVKAVTKIISQLSKTDAAVMSSLDLTCKDEIEFDYWILGLKALVCSSNQMELSKQELLSHSRRFRKALEASGCGANFASLRTVNDAGIAGLEECLELPVHSIDEVEKKLARLKSNCKKLNEKTLIFDIQYHLLNEGQTFCTTEQQPPTTFDMMPVTSVDNVTTDISKAHESLFNDRSQEEDDRLEYMRMQSLLCEVKVILENAELEIQKYKDFVGSSSSSSKSSVNQQLVTLKKINQIIWKSEVDYENIEDMLKRLKARRSNHESINPLEDLTKKFVQINSNLTQEFQKIGKKVSGVVNQFFNLTGFEDLPQGPSITTDFKSLN